eukprot:6185821-Pleurochrysis_carterae.AAC.4
MAKVPRRACAHCMTFADRCAFETNVSKISFARLTRHISLQGGEIKARTPRAHAAASLAQQLEGPEGNLAAPPWLARVLSYLMRNLKRTLGPSAAFISSFV